MAASPRRVSASRGNHPARLRGARRVAQAASTCSNEDRDRHRHFRVRTARISRSCYSEKGYRVFGTYRRTSSVNFWRIEELGISQHPQLELVEYDLTDLGASINLVQRARPDEIYNLAAQSFVGVSFEQPVTTAQITGIGALNLLEAIRIVDSGIRFYQASTSEMFGKVQQVPQTEEHVFLSAQPVRRCEALCPLDDSQLPGVLRHFRRQRAAVQSRVAPERPRIRNPQDH